MIVLMKCLNEEKLVNRCLKDFHDEPWLEKIIVIDGGSTDYTVQEIKRFSKAQVFIHPWIDWYHDMEVCQSNIALSYIPNGKPCFILDFDERMSDGLKARMSAFDDSNFWFGDKDVVQVPRKTFDVIRYDESPHAIIGFDGWPLISHQIGQYPDYQCRVLLKSPFHRWINSPHHVISGQKGDHILDPNQDVHIIHYEKDDFRDRDRIEAKWLRAQVRRMELGLTADSFECKVKPEYSHFLNKDYWINPKG